jgi:uncharacterized GH25 family protein
MKRLLGTLALLLALSLPARGHFVFLLPADGSRTVRAVFSDSLEPDRPELLKKVAHTRFSSRMPDGDVALKATTVKNALELTVGGTGPAWVVGVCPYGVTTRGKEPFLLSYYCKTLVGTTPGKAPAAEVLGQRFASLKLEVVPVPGKEPAVRLLWEGKPLAAAQVVLYVPGKDKAVETKADKDGLVMLERATKAGLYGVRAFHEEKKKGSQDGKEYASMRSYSTLTFPASALEAVSLRGSSPKTYRIDTPAKKDDTASEGNPEATKLLADALAARANWDNFPGFSADLTVNVEGKIASGKVEVSSKGKVTLKLEGEAKEWAHGLLASLVSHRMGGPPDKTPACAFPDELADHPLGRAVKVVNDVYHSSYRIRDRQVTEVNRRMGESRFTISVLKNHVNTEKKFLPSTYAVNTWDTKTGALKKSETHYNTWKRVGDFDLPLAVMVVTATEGKQVTRTIKLANLALQK